MLYLITALVLIAYLLFSWFLASWMHLHAPSLWILRSGLGILGCIAAAAFVWFRRQPISKTQPPRLPDRELDFLFRAAEAKLKSARLPRGSSIGTAPVAAVIGFSGSAKTSVVKNSGIDPELLAGAISEDGEIASTSLANIWYAAGTVFVEAAGTILLDEKRWAAFLDRIRPSRLRSTIGGAPLAPRLALVCFDAEVLTSDPNETAKQAKILRAKLSEFAANLGAQLPVYVLFTRADKIPHFVDAVSTLSHEEIESVLGCTLGLEAISPGLYSEQQTARISRSFDALFQSVADLRLDLLPRESDTSKAGCAYEFAREFLKLRSSVSDFLVELCRPSQFGVGALLRGYYFSGVRPIVVERVAPVSAPASAKRIGSEASMLFRAVALAEPEIMPAVPVRTSRRVPQWVFLNRLFRDILLADRAASGASEFSTHTNTARRILLACAACLSLLVVAGFTVSWLNNRTLQSAALDTARSLSLEPSTGGASLDSLQRLDTLRTSLETLGSYQSQGAPLRYRWGLYSGNALYPELEKIYFDHFRALLLADTQAHLVEQLRSLPAKPAADYGFVYDSLKAYLITTSNHDRSTPSFLAPVLLDRWVNRRTLDPTRSALAARQFTFYATQLKQKNPFNSNNDEFAVARARNYLAQFGGMERIYAAILLEASNRLPAIVFNQQFPAAKPVLNDAYPVASAFTQSGWRFVNDAIRNPAQYFSGEQWVLGTVQNNDINLEQNRNQLRRRYTEDFLNAWRRYLKSASLTPYASIADASRKLDLLSGNRSPLLALFSLASQNTAVDDPAVAGAFQAVQAVVPPTSTQSFIAAANQNYMSALLALQSSLQQAAARPADTADTSAPILASAANADVAAKQLAQSFRPDPSGRVDVTVKKLLEDPITNVEALAQAAGPAQLNAKVKALCSQLSPLLAKYPFKRTASAEATIAELNAALRKSDGAFWSSYTANLQKFVVRQGTRFVPAPASSIQLGPAALAFLDQIAQLSDDLYPAGADDPQFTYTLTPEPTEGIQQLTLVLDGQTFSYTGGNPSPRQFVWKGSTAHEAAASVRFGNSPDLVWSKSEGPWAVLHFFDKADHGQVSASDPASFEWTIRIGKDAITLQSGKPLTVHLTLNAMSVPIFIDRQYLSHLACNALANP